MEKFHIPLSTLFHVGLAHNTSGTETLIPAIIILLPSGGVSFICFGGLIKVKVTGNVIGELRHEGVRAALNTAYKELELVFEQVAGVQALKLILFGGVVLAGQHLTAEAPLEEAGHESTDTLNEFKNGAGAPTEIELVE